MRCIIMSLKRIAFVEHIVSEGITYPLFGRLNKQIKENTVHKF